MPKLLTACIASALFALGCGGPNRPITESLLYNVLGHQNLSYVWVFPGELTGEEQNAPAGWLFWENEGSLEGSVWIAPMSDRIVRQSGSRDAMAQELDYFGRDMLNNAALMALNQPDSFSFSLAEERHGRERMNGPVEIRIYNLQLGSLDEKLPSYIADWTAHHMGGRAKQIQRGTAAGSFQIVTAMAPLIYPTGEIDLDPNGNPLAIFAVWVAVTNRLPAPEKFKEWVLDFAEVLPVASRFASIAATEVELRQPEREKSVAIIATFDHNVILQDERERVREDFMAALAAASQAGVQFRVGLVRACEAAFVKSVGGDDFISSSSSEFASEIRARFDQMFTNDSLDCLANLAQRSAILAAQQSGEQWENADERWFFWLTKRADVANVSLQNVNIGAIPNEYRAALGAENASYYAVGPADLYCSDTDKSTSQYEPNVAQAFYSKIAEIGGIWLEYCSDWSATLGANWASRTASSVGLSISRTPLPGTLKVYASAGTESELSQDSDFGYSYDPGSGAIVPGASVEFSLDDVWRAEFTTILEPVLPNQ